MPSMISGSLGIETQITSLEIDAKTEGLGRACRAKLVFPDEHAESCIAVPKIASLALETLQVLNACSHPNIAKPIGFWEDKKKKQGYILFHNFDGLLSSLPKDCIFEVDDEDQPEGQPSISGFSKAGLNMMREVVSAVKYVNDHYQQEAPQAENCIPVKSLNIESVTVFYQLKADGHYLVLLSDIEDNIHKCEKDKSKNVIGKTKEKKKAPFRTWQPRDFVKKEKAIAGNPGEVPDVRMICSKNWNNVGKYIAQLSGEWTVNFEVNHLVGRLKEEGVKYDDLVWEAGLWDLSTKVQFIREIFWFYDKNTTRLGELVKKDPLGLQSCIDRLGVMVTKDRGTPFETTEIMDERNLFNSLDFLRIFILAHQAKVLKGISGPKVVAPDQKSAERFVSKKKPDYYVILIKEIRSLNWFKTSPFLRSGHNYMVDFQENLARVKKLDDLNTNLKEAQASNGADSEGLEGGQLGLVGPSGLSEAPMG